MMENGLLKELYHCFYIPPEFSKQKEGNGRKSERADEDIGKNQSAGWCCGLLMPRIV